MSAVYKTYCKGHTIYAKIVELPNHKFQIKKQVTAVNPDGVATAPRFNTFEEAEKTLYKHRPGSRRIA